jgi:hypothetical protein
VAGLQQWRACSSGGLVQPCSNSSYTWGSPLQLLVQRQKLSDTSPVPPWLLIGTTVSPGINATLAVPATACHKP